VQIERGAPTIEARPALLKVLLLFLREHRLSISNNVLACNFGGVSNLAHAVFISVPAKITVGAHHLTALTQGNISENKALAGQIPRVRIWHPNCL
jgi:hypothetical protein